MSDITVKRVDEFDSPNGGGFCRARASLGVTAFGMQVEHFPPHFEHFPEHDHAEDGQEEVYTALSGAATLHARDEQYELVPGTFARVGPSCASLDHDRRPARAAPRDRRNARPGLRRAAIHGARGASARLSATRAIRVRLPCVLETRKSHKGKE